MIQLSARFIPLFDPWALLLLRFGQVGDFLLHLRLLVLILTIQFNSNEPSHPP